MHTAAEGRDSTVAKIKQRPNYYKEVEEKVISSYSYLLIEMHGRACMHAAIIIPCQLNSI